MPKAYKDISASQSARNQLNQSYQASGAAATQQIVRNTRYEQQAVQDNLNAITNDNIRNAQVFNWVNMGLNIAGQIVDTTSSIYNIVNQDQTGKANTRNAERLNTGSDMITASIMDGSSYWGDDGTGKMTLILSPEIMEWKSAMEKEISESKGLSSVRQNELEAFQLGFSNIKSQGFTKAITKAYEGVQTNFAANLATNKQTDVASYVQARGDLELWNTMQIQGVATIQNRTDWDQNTKAGKTTEYLQEVMVAGNTQLATNTAMTQGKEAAWDWLNAPEQSWMTPEQIQNAYTTASNAVSLRAGAVGQNSSDAMRTALTSSDPEQKMTAADTRIQIEQRYATEAPEVRQAAIDSATKVQKEIMSISGTNTLNRDIEAGLPALQETYSRLMAGEFDANYVGIEAEKESLIAKYQAQISTAEKNIASATSTTASQVRTANRNAVSDYTTSSNTIMDLFDSGAISGAEAMDSLLSAAVTFTSRLEGEDAGNYAMQIQGTVGTFLDKLCDNYLPSKYKGLYTDALTGFKEALGLNLPATNLDEQQKIDLAQYQFYYAGMVADWIYENGATATPEEFTAYCQNIGQHVALSYTDKNWTTISRGTAITGSNAKAIGSSFKTTNNLVWNSDNDSYFMYQDNAQADKKTANALLSGNVEIYDPATVFATEGASATFNSMADYVATQISYYTGESFESLRTTATVGRDDQGKLNLSPVVRDSNGNSYRIKDDYIQMTPAGAGSAGWKSTGIQPKPTEAEVTRQVNGQMMKPGNKAYDDAWAAGMAKQQASDAEKNRQAAVGTDPVVQKMDRMAPPESVAPSEPEKPETNVKERKPAVEEKTAGAVFPSMRSLMQKQ